MENEIVKDLYHRPPYLLIQKIEYCDDKKVIAMTKLEGNEFFFQGHFPNAPVLPGALMQEMTTQSAGVLIARHYNPLGDEYDTENFDPQRPALGVLSRVKDARYKTFAKPGDLLTIEAKLIERLENFFEFKASIKKGDELVMKNHFVLTNIPSSHLL